MNPIIKLNKVCDSTILLKYGFKKSKNNFVISIPLYTYKDYIVIEVRFLISLENKYIHFDIIDVNSDSIYTAFYDNEFSNLKDNKVLKIVKRNLNKNLLLMKKANIIL